jgi:hypothetical protein
MAGRKKPMLVRSWALLIGALLTATGMLAALWWSRQRQRQVVTKIRTLGGVVQTETIGPRWISRLPGAGYLPRRVFGVHLHGPRVTDDELVRLKVLTGLQRLSLTGTRVTDAGLAHLESFNHLERLYLEDGLDAGGITDAGLLHLRGLTNLKFLQVPCIHVTGWGIDQLERSLPNLRVGRECRF